MRLFILIACALATLPQFASAAEWYLKSSQEVQGVGQFSRTFYVDGLRITRGRDAQGKEIPEHKLQLSRERLEQLQKLSVASQGVGSWKDSPLCPEGPCSQPTKSWIETRLPSGATKTVLFINGYAGTLRIWENAAVHELIDAISEEE